MSAAPLPHDEADRLDALLQLDVLDSAPEQEFDALARVAAAVCGTPIALVSLIDAQRQWFKARVGLPGVDQTPREASFCAHALLGEALLEVHDTHRDPRFADNPLVTGAPHLRFYAGVPLQLASGARVGTLCVADLQPRRLDAVQREVLAQLATAAARALEGRRALMAERRLREAAWHAAALVHNSVDAIVALAPDGTVTHWNAAAARLFGTTAEQMRGQPIARLVPDGCEPAWEDPAALLARQPEGLQYDTVRLHRDGGPIDVSVSLAPIHAPDGRLVGATKIIRDIRAQVRAAQALSDERRRLAWIIEGTGAGTWEWNVQTGETRFNARWAEIIGRTLRELAPVSIRTWFEHAHPEDLERSAALLQRHFEGESDSYDCELRMRHRDGHWVWVHDRGRVMTRSADGRPEWMFGTHVDISARKRQEEALRRLGAELAEQHERLRVTLDSIGDAVITTDAAARVTWLNPVAERLTGWPAARARGRALAEVFRLVGEHTRAPRPCPVAACLYGDPVQGPVEPGVLLAQNGRDFAVEESAAPIRREDGAVLGAVLVFRDVTEQRRIAGELRYRATHDALTGLVNREEFEARLQRLLERAQQERSEHALLVLDLDQFKLVNDRCGHAAGDRLLQQVTKLLRETLRARDTLARLGGDEFAVILEHCDCAHAQQLAQQICQRLNDFRFVSEGERLRIGASIGLVPVDERWRTLGAVMQAADSACYAAKDGGRNRVHVWLDSDETLRVRHGEMRLAARLEQALDEDRFVLHAQRIQALDDAGAKLHAEVLLRLREPDGSLVAPGAFLPAAERFHLASRIDRWVLAHTIALLQAQPDLGGIELLSVNLSGQSIGDRAFHREAIAALTAAGPALCRCLCLEITETAAVTNMADAVRFIAQAHALGLRIALDDFGAGASSFGYLTSLPIDLLKIDGQFVRSLMDDALDDVTVRCFQEVARVIGVRTVAEFVDRPGVLARLREIGVDYAQGYLLHRPEPAAQLLRMAAWPGSGQA
ncbi:EAL domain-containing protein [Azohydromonas caseinilytica]|uniref:EAL domain-containing protein n=1 Tax=Azohydromonas caseinilytica TaxID=2728836 RepID=A0A848FCZ2_9BURK|nr:EAL domain-containing protein [Azohydromonas caseinilytica]NML17218.1 EAL domain-containing protein [Azohydromonas caseinilytica]